MYNYYTLCITFQPVHKLLLNFPLKPMEWAIRSMSARSIWISQSLSMSLLSSPEIALKMYSMGPNLGWYARRLIEWKWFGVEHSSTTCTIYGVVCALQLSDNTTLSLSNLQELCFVRYQGTGIYFEGEFDCIRIECDFDRWSQLWIWLWIGVGRQCTYALTSKGYILHLI